PTGELREADAGADDGCAVLAEQPEADVLTCHEIDDETLLACLRRRFRELLRNWHANPWSACVIFELRIGLLQIIIFRAGTSILNCGAHDPVRTFGLQRECAEFIEAMTGRLLELLRRLELRRPAGHEGRIEGLDSVLERAPLTAQFDPDGGTIRIFGACWSRRGKMSRQRQHRNARKQLPADGNAAIILLNQFTHWRFPLTSSS